MSPSDTIFALSSAPGRAGVAVIRISGPQAGLALEDMAGACPPPRVAHLTRLNDPGTGEALDEGLVLWFPAPNSFTGEDVAELHLHGGRSVVAGTIAALSALPGLRPAEAGEFTRRAFDNGKLDLSQVEGLADLIDAETDAQRRQALRQMEGGLSRWTETWRGRLTRLLAHVEAAIDFPDEDLPDDLTRRVRLDVAALRAEILRVLGDDRRGERLRDGLYIAILGPPNVGKSSLLNALAQRDVAIVSEVAGTTRDLIEVHLDLGGYPVTLADTAGLRELEARGALDGQSAIEAEGMRRARAGAAAADLKLTVLDVREHPEFDRLTLGLIDDDTIVLLNKTDLAAGPIPDTVAGRAAIGVSAKTGAGLPDLLERLAGEVADRLSGGGTTAPALTRARHRRALEDCAHALQRASSAKLTELAAEDLRLATRALGRITGRVDVEDVLDIVFRDFCIGK